MQAAILFGIKSSSKFLIDKQSSSRDTATSSEVSHLHDAILAEAPPAGIAQLWLGEAKYSQSIAEVLLDHVGQRLARAIARELIEEQAHGVFQPVRRVVGAMWGQQHVF